MNCTNDTNFNNIDNSEPEKVALHRSGRVKVFTVPSPGPRAKAKLFRYFLRAANCVYRGDPQEIASTLPHFRTGAYIETIVAEIVAQRRQVDDTTPITNKDLLRAMFSRDFGAEQELVLTEEQRRRVAYHELGHYLVAKEHGYEISFVSVDRHAEKLGLTHILPHESDFVTTTEDLKCRMQIFMGGYMAEHAVFHDITLGSHDDINNIHHFYGLYLQLTRRQTHPSRFSRSLYETQLDIPGPFLREQEERVAGILGKYTDKMEPLVVLLLEEGTVEASQLDAILAA